MQVPIFKIFVGWRTKKVPKVPFFRLGGNTGELSFTRVRIAVISECVCHPGIPLLGNLSLDWEFQQRLWKNLGN